MFSKIKNKNVILSYFGINSDEITTKLIGVMEQGKLLEESNNKMLKRMPFLIAECFQNLVRHGEKGNESNGKDFFHRDFFQIMIEPNFVIISSANIVKSSSVPEIQKNIDTVNSLSPEELKELKLKVLMYGESSDLGGAGLGLIEMAYRTGRPLKTKFVDVSEEYSRFYLSTSLGDDTEADWEIDQIESDYLDMLRENIFLLYKGDITSNSTSFIIEMLRENFSNEKLPNQSKKELNIIIEILNNASKHGLSIDGKKEGLIALFSKDNIYSIYSGNYISNHDAEKLSSGFSQIYKTTISELTKIYRESLSAPNDKNIGIGLIEIARQTNKSMDFEIYEIKNKGKFLDLEVELS